MFFLVQRYDVFASTGGISPKGVGKIPTSLFRACAVLYIIRYRTGEERKGLREVFRCF